ncbi:type II toxin-antitoxin system Phd/YefM family antitoxin [Kroppenstedtia eburnea]|uniref:Antitoxin n=1 Tax=Kroppenstedtia eburnea TaxID=714067 RepID=A0A1N7KXJ2_9BACL|nr:type II toxin-antitoxin system Phd/YefM family antitoxin [Kroppenstedtia eburnea]EGK12681.1 prevent-host-death family antitoxin [Desmospora sp. 8437]QKI82761.1 type II toxin-antitoxin system Phd/YefM family antitoxin [Kroppenstedtia eburnea]SIS66313.1 prevent-host-death family protein [Kroppenstedtia eburnea]
MHVSATELKTNLGKYIELAATEDIIITRNGKDVALLTSVEGKKRDALKSLRGIIKDTDVTRDDIREERLDRHRESID